MDNLMTNVDKWNHDVQNDIIGVNYLMNMRRYPEAERFCEKILTCLSRFPERQGKMSEDIKEFQAFLQEKKYPEAHYKLHLLTTEFESRQTQNTSSDEFIKNIINELEN